MKKPTQQIVNLRVLGLRRADCEVELERPKDRRIVTCCCMKDHEDSLPITAKTSPENFGALTVGKTTQVALYSTDNYHWFTNEQDAEYFKALKDHERLFYDQFSLN